MPVRSPSCERCSRCRRGACQLARTPSSWLAVGFTDTLAQGAPAKFTAPARATGSVADETVGLLVRYAQLIECVDLQMQCDLSYLWPGILLQLVEAVHEPFVQCRRAGTRAGFVQ